MNVVDLKNIVLSVTKKIWSSVHLECKIMSQVRKIMFKQIVAVLFDWRFSYSPFQYGRYIHAVIVFQWFFRSLPSEVLYYFRRIYTIPLTTSFLPQWFVYPSILRMCRWYIFSSQRVGTRFAGETVRNNRRKYLFLQIDKLVYFSCFSFSFSFFEHVESLPVISSFWKFFHVPIWLLPILDAHPFSGRNLS